MKLVQWSSHVDSNGKPMLLIGAAHYPQALAAEIAIEIHELHDPYRHPDLSPLRLQQAWLVEHGLPFLHPSRDCGRAVGSPSLTRSGR